MDNQEQAGNMEQQTIMTMLQSLQQIMQQQQQQAEQIANLRTQPTRPTVNNNENQNLAKIIRPRQPDTFHGERTVQQVEAWLYSLEKYAEFVNIDNHQLVLFAVTLLRDGAATWWRGIEYDMTTTTLSTWSEFKRVFKYEFKPANAEQLARQRLQQLQQTGTVEQYVREFRSLMPELPDMDTKDALFNFVQGLKYQCRLQVLMQKPFSLSEAYAYAEAYETAEQCAKVGNNRRQSNFSPFNKSFGQPSSSYVNHGPTPMDLDAIKPVDRRYGGSNGGGSNGGRSNDGIMRVKCFKCGERGHIRRDCKNRHQENRKHKQDFRPVHNQ